MNRNLVNSFSERIQAKFGGLSRKATQRAVYGVVFVLILSFVATSYVTADSSNQVTLPGVAGGDNINVNLLQGQKVDQVATANAVSSSVSASSGGQLASGAVAARTTTASDVKSANIASSVASAVNLSSSNSVSSSAESANVSAELAQADATSVSKQQIVEPTTESKSLNAYVVKQGDTAETVAQAYGVSAQTVRWANGLKDNNLTPGATITVPAVDGVVYTVKEGDTLEALANKYHSNVDATININNLSGDSAPVGSLILLPDGVLPETDRPEYVAPVTTTTTNRSNSTQTSSSSATRATLTVPSISGNRYAYGYCTWYAYNRRVQLGLPVANGWGNANTWARMARASGYTVDHIPSVGAIFQTTAGYYGHVGIVERVNPDGSIFVSEMNYSGWNVISTRTIYNPGSYSFIH